MSSQVSPDNKRYVPFTRYPSKHSRILFLLLQTVCAFASPAFGQSTAAPPNIVIILADDLGYGDVGFNGCPDIPTPNIDALANNGVRCTNGYVTHPFCTPSRAALLTGRYQQRFGLENLTGTDTTNPRAGLPMQEVLLPEILQPAGYVCGAVGKWHLGFTPNFHPMQRGFDEFFGFLGGSSTYFNARVERNMTYLTETEYLTDAFTREAVSFINRHATQPFFLYLAYNAVHDPYDQPPAIYMNRVANISDTNRRVYAAMVTALDDGVGQVLQTLQAQNLLDKTLIFFLSDNGAPDTGFTRNLPLSGYKFDVLEGGIRVPFAIQWNGRLPGHGLYSDPVSSLDIMATAAAAAGISLPSDRAFDGINLVPFLANEQASPQRTLFWRHFGLGKDGPPGCLETVWAVRNGPLKLVTARATVYQPPSLYDLSNDVGETQDLAASRPGDVDALNKLYGQWSAQLVSPLWQRFSDSHFFSVVLAGDWNAFNKNDSTQPWQLISISPPGPDGTPDGLRWLTSTIHVAATGGDTTPGVHTFALIDNQTYSRQWGGVAVNVDDITTVPFFSGSALGPTNTISLEDGFFYSFRIINQREQPTEDLKLAVMKTSALPVSVTPRAQIPLSPTSGDSVVVNIVTSQPKSREERIYLRWSTDFFITSHMVEAVGSGVNYSATIPAQPARTGVEYCLTTSTVDLSPFATSGPIDALTLSTSKNSKFVVRSATDPTPTPTPTPSPTPVPTPTNQRPAVNAGPDQTVATHSTTLNGSGMDDGLPNPPATLTYTWSKVNGPGTVSFGNAHAATTSASFSAAGVYTLQLAASDSVLSGGDIVVLTVNKSPIANAGPDQTITLPNTATLSGSGTDDGLPNPPGTLSYTWNKVSGPGSVSFANVHAASTTATFAVAGTYSLKLTASDSVFVSTDTVTISVNPDPTPRADLKVTVSDSKATVFAGQKDTYIIVVTNVGPNSANGAAVIDSFPAFFTGVTFTTTQTGGATGFTASGSGNINDKVSMPSGSKVTYVVTGTISPSASGTLSITASATPPNGLNDPNTANNSASDTDTITFKADLKVTISDGKTATAAGQKDTYTIVLTNLGPTNVAGAVIQDNFPATFAGVTFTATQTGGASGFSASGSGNINDTVTMPAGSKITYKASGTISASATGSLSNTATVTSPTGVPDPNSANNSATDTDTI